MKNLKLKKFNTIGKEELKAASKVIRSGILSDFFAKEGDNFLGGKYVKKFETECKKYFKTKYAITVNSWTSGLIAIIGSINIKPGDEVILSPWTMSACATSILHWGGIPVFCDIDEKTFNIDPKKIEKRITNKTKAVMAIDFFGQPCDVDEIKKICKKKNIVFICDSAQSIGAKYKNKYTSVDADVGGYSLNFHKHINTGEGGIIITNQKKIAEKCQLIRNHAESVIKPNIKRKELVNMVGYNFRLTEIQAAIGSEQLKKLNSIVKKKIWSAKILSDNLRHLPGLSIPYLSPNRTHCYYSYPIKVNQNITGINRDKIWRELKKEGVPVNNKINCLHLLPIFQKKIAYGPYGFPWGKSKKNNQYKKGSLPVAENLSKNSILCIQMWAFDFKKKDLIKITDKFKLVWKKLKII